MNLPTTRPKPRMFFYLPQLNEFAVKRSVKYEDFKAVLLSLLDQLSGLTVKWFTDNQNVPRIVSIFNTCCSLSFSIVMEWITTRLIFK